MYNTYRVNGNFLLKTLHDVGRINWLYNEYLYDHVMYSAGTAGMCRCRDDKMKKEKNRMNLISSKDGRKRVECII